MFSTPQKLSRSYGPLIPGLSAQSSTSPSVNTPSTPIESEPQASTPHQMESLQIRQNQQHGQYIRSTSNTSHCLSSADTIPDVRSRTPDTEVGRSTADVGCLFRSMVTDSASLFNDIQEEDDSSREVIINLVPISNHSQECRSTDLRSETPDLSQMAQDQILKNHEPLANPSNEDENQNPVVHLAEEQDIEQIEHAPLQPEPQQPAPFEEPALNEMMNLARRYRADSRQIEEVLSAHLKR
ncbi:uncharacterized protein LOC128647748 [Bombina bombina]|uniref:uncharacterized protein LOC128647748 n=1 Tax=Bombina bombina TaxID=8345 RepID=UPI00235AE332|nr:uncharacterized protein LOC128647748 [Bombina bombina]